jgi:inner membrane protein
MTRPPATAKPDATILMFNSTHTLAGLALARNGLNRWAPNATWTAVIAANLPDIDIVTGFNSTASYIDHHRGFTHSLAGVPVLSALLALVMYAVSKRDRKSIVPFWRHFAVALVAIATHPLLDGMNSYGMRPFLPFDDSWYYGDVLPIIDPYLDLILLAALLDNRRSILLAALLYVGVRTDLQRTSERQLAGYTADIPDVIRSASIPDLLNPFRRTGFVETNEAIARVSISVRNGLIREMDHFPKIPRGPVLSAAEATSTGKVLLHFARFAITKVESDGSGYRVLLIDYRFLRKASGVALAAEILLRPDLSVAAESMSFTQPIE